MLKLLKSSTPDLSAAASAPAGSSRRCTKIRTIASNHWVKLMGLGVPSADAWNISVAITKFDFGNKDLEPEQRELINQYSPLICRAKLWRRELLSHSDI
ncbi:MAG: hypothetical protein F6K19_07115 [Cyanothece sp. SIO1E1]|nr:hypothetical protein [Cyanothece sp. SIO1E1]